MIHSPNFAKCLQETEFTFHCVWYIEPVYSTGRVAISQKANEIQFEFPTKMIGKMVVHNATILRSLPNFVVPCYTSQETCGASVQQNSRPNVLILLSICTSLQTPPWWVRAKTDESHLPASSPW